MHPNLLIFQDQQFATNFSIDSLISEPYKTVSCTSHKILLNSLSKTKQQVILYGISDQKQLKLFDSNFIKKIREIPIIFFISQLEIINKLAKLDLKYKNYQVFPIITTEIVAKTIIHAHRKTEKKYVDDKASNIYRTILNSSRDAIVFTDTQGFIIKCNPSTKQLVNFPEEEDSFGINMMNFVPEEEHEKVSNAYQSLFQGKISSDMVFTMKRMDGSIFFANINGEAVYKENNELDGMVSVIKDITQWIEAQDEIKQSELKYRTLFESAGDSIFILDGKSIIDCNKATLKIFGVNEKSEIIGKTPFDFSPEFQENGEKSIILGESYIKQALEGKTTTFYWIHHRKDGTNFDAEITLNRFLFESYFRVIAIIRDVSEQNKAQRKLIESDEKNRALSEATNEAIFFSEKGYCVETNEAATNMFGYSYDELIGIFGIDVIAEKSRELVAQNMLSDYEEPYEAIAQRKDGSKFWAMFHGKMYTYKGKKVRLTVVRDIDDRKKALIELIKAKEKAEESDKLKSAFLATMSHELRTPLNAIIGFSDLFNEALSKDDMIDFSKTINKSGMHLLNIIEDILEISMLETGAIFIKDETIIIQDLMIELREILNSGIKKAEKPEIKSRYQPDSKNLNLIIKGDYNKIKQIIIHLLSNSIKFINEGFIEFGYQLSEDEDNIIFYVKDTGIGIDKKFHDIIFDRFRQIDDSHTRIYGGTGLGLCIVKNLTELMGGKIWLESEPGKGSIFYCSFPCKLIQVNKQKIEKKKPESIALDTIKKTILIAEDEESSFIFLQAVLKKNISDILWAKNGVEAIKLFKENPNINLVLMDLKMPELNGYEAAKTIRKINNKIPIIAQTAYAMPGDRDKVISHGFDDYISKPIKKDDLLKIISKHLK